MRAFYLDNPEEAATVHLLSEIGITGATAPARSSSDKAISTSPQLRREHKGGEARVVACSAGRVFVDVRDDADAWVRVVLEAGHAVGVAAGRFVRLDGDEASEGAVVAGADAAVSARYDDASEYLSRIPHYEKPGKMHPR